MAIVSAAIFQGDLGYSLARASSTRCAGAPTVGRWHRLALAGLILLAAAAAAAADDDEVVLEAELCRELTYPWQPILCEGASGGLALALPEGAGSSEAYAFGQEGEARFALPGGDGPGRNLWLRLYWNGNCSNSLFVSLPPTEGRVNVADHAMRAWHWVMVPDLVVSPWHQEVVLRNREDGIWVDQLCLRPVGSPPPRGPRPATTPWPAPAPAVPMVTVTPAAVGAALEALPPTEYLLHHSLDMNVPMPRQPVVTVFPSRETTVDLWLRWNRPATAPPAIAFDGNPRLQVSPQPMVVAVDGPERLERHRVAVRPRGDLPRGLSVLYARVRTADGLEQVHPLRVLRPYRWRVSAPLRLNPAAGLDALDTLDRRLLADPLDPAHGLDWRLVEPDAFTRFGLLDLRRAVSPRPFSQAYAFTQVEADAAGPAVLDLTHDDWIRVWINGDLIHSSAASAPSTLTRTRLPVTLRQGSNDILVRSCQLKNYWEFGLLLEPLPEADALLERLAPDLPPPSPASATAAVAEAAGVAAAAKVFDAALIWPAGDAPWLPLPPWSPEGLTESLEHLIAERPSDEAWRVIDQLCREAPLPPIERWPQWIQWFRSRLRDGDAQRHGAAALEVLRVRAEAADLPDAERAVLVYHCHRQRAALLVQAGEPLAAADALVAALCWADRLHRPAALHAEVIRLCLRADDVTAAAAYLATIGLEAAPEWHGLLALYTGDLDAAASHYGQPRQHVAGLHATWLLALGRAAEAEWLLRRVIDLPPGRRLILARACAEQQNFAECESILLGCLMDPAASRPVWEHAAADWAAFHKERCTLDAARHDLVAWGRDVGHHNEEDQRRLWTARHRLEDSAEDPVAALDAAIALAEIDATGYRASALRPSAAGAAAPVAEILLGSGRHAEMLRLCNDLQALAPSQHLQWDIWRVQALVGLSRPAAAEAILARLRAAVAADPSQARPLLAHVVLADAASPAVASLARVALEGSGGDGALGSTVCALLACQAAAAGDNAQALDWLAQALERSGLASEPLSVQVSRCRTWIRPCLRLGRDSRGLLMGLLMSPHATLSAAVVQMLTEEMGLGNDEAAEGVPVPPISSEAVVVPEDHFYWLVAPGTFPRCAPAHPGAPATSFESALAAFGKPLPVGDLVVPFQGLVWVGTDRGLFVYRRRADRWDRLQLPGQAEETPIGSLDVDGACLMVGWTTADGQAGRAAYDLDAATWATPAPP